MSAHPIVLAALRRDMGEAEFKLRRLESEWRAVPAGAKATMSTMRLTKQIAEAKAIHESWQRLVLLAGAKDGWAEA